MQCNRDLVLGCVCFVLPEPSCTTAGMKGLHTRLVSKAGKKWQVVDPSLNKPGKHLIVGHIEEREPNMYRAWLWDEYPMNSSMTYPSLNHAHHELNEQYVAKLMIKRLSK